MLKLIFFDFDGTIVESADIKTNAFRKLFSFSPRVGEIVEYHRKNAGVSRFQKFDYIYKNILKEPLGDAKKKELSERFSQFVLEEIISCPPVPGAMEFLSKYGKRIGLYVVSSAPHEELRRIIEKRAMAGFFRDAVGAPAKKSDSVRAILEKEKAAASEALFVGDSTADYEEAKRAGVRFVARVAGSADAGSCAFPKGIKTVNDFFELDKMVEEFL